MGGGHIGGGHIGPPLARGGPDLRLEPLAVAGPPRFVLAREVDACGAILDRSALETRAVTDEGRIVESRSARLPKQDHLLHRHREWGPCRLDSYLLRNERDRAIGLTRSRLVHKEDLHAVDESRPDRLEGVGQIGVRQCDRGINGFHGARQGVRLIGRVESQEGRVCQVALKTRGQILAAEQALERVAEKDASCHSRRGIVVHDATLEALIDKVVIVGVAHRPTGREAPDLEREQDIRAWRRRWSGAQVVVKKAHRLAFPHVGDCPLVGSRYRAGRVPCPWRG